MKYFVIFFIFCFSIIAFAQEFPYNSNTRISPSIGPIATDQVQVSRYISNAPIWNGLKKMTMTERENSFINILLEKDATPEALEKAKQIENLWNTGQFDDALNQFKNLELLTNMNEVSISNSWRTPVESFGNDLWGDDVRIGTRDSVIVSALDIDHATGNLFAVLLLEGDGNTNRWNFYISTDGGVTWSETFDWWANYNLPTMSASVVAGYCYVGFARGSANDQAFLLRFDVTNGQVTNFSTGMQFHTVFTTVQPNAIKEVSLTSNQDYFNNRLYYCTINTDGTLQYFWGLGPDFVTWNEIATNVTNAKNGLDVTSNERYSGHYSWASYVDNQNTLHIDGVAIGDTWDPITTYPVGSAGDYSSVGAWGDTVTCYFDYTGSVIHCRYLVSYDGGGSWFYGFVGDTTTLSESPAISARKGGGVGLIYRYYTSPRQERFSWRYYRGGWNAPLEINRYEPYYDQPAIEYLGNNIYGSLYLSWTTPVVRAAYFDRSDWVSGIDDADRNTSLQEYQLLQNYPNPFNPSTTIEYILPQEANVSLEIYNIIGQKIVTLVNERQSAGHKKITWDAGSVASGIYLYKLKTEKYEETRKMFLIR